MKRKYLIPTFAAGLSLGFAAAYLWCDRQPIAHAASSDRFQDYVMVTGAVSLNARTQLDGVWMLDYRAGKLLASCVDKSQGKMMPWAEVDLVTEFNVAPKQDVHFMMTTGYIAPGQSALYVAETVTGKFGVYTMASGANGNGVVVRRHDVTSFRTIADPATIPVNPIQPLDAPPQVGNAVPPVGAVPTPAVVPAPAVAPGLPVVPPPPK